MPQMRGLILLMSIKRSIEISNLLLNLKIIISKKTLSRKDKEIICSTKRSLLLSSTDP